jgi:polysaccharide export outer membrane protein
VKSTRGIHFAGRTIRHLFMLVVAAGSFAFAADYKLGPEDLLKIEVFDHPELSVQTRVSASGNISVPLVGQINVGGMSTRNLEEALTSRWSDGGFVRKPQVSVLVSEYMSQKVAVMGQVAKPGQYALSTANTVRDILAQAGGLNNGGTGLPTGFGVNGVAGDEATLIHADGTKVTLDLHALLEGDPAQNPQVTAGDAIYVPRAPMFYIYGEVQRPGQYRLERNMSVVQAIAAGGGLTPKGTEFGMKVKRRNSAGVLQDVSVKGRDPLKADDVVTIRQSWF